LLIRPRITHSTLNQLLTVIGKLLWKQYINYIKSKKPILAGIAVFLIATIITQSLTYQHYLLSKEQVLQNIVAEAEDVKDRLKTSLSFSLSATKTLAFLVEAQGVPTDFDSIAKEIIESNKYIDALELTQGGIITHVYPLKGNEDAIGYDILANPATREEALRALESRALFFAGPLELKQGGLAVVGRLPIFRNNVFFGFSVVLIKLKTLLEAAGIGAYTDRYFEYQLSKVNPTTQREEFFFPNAIPPDHHYVAVGVPDGEWKLYVISKDNGAIFMGVFGFASLGFVLSVFVGVFSWHLVRQPQKLNALVKERTRQLVSEKNISADIINALPGVFYLYARSGKFLRWNKNLETVSGYSGKEIAAMHALDFFYGEEAKLVENRIAEVFRNGEADVRASYYTKQKQKIPYYFNGRKAVFNGEEFLIGMGIDISDQVEAEQKLRERTAEIQQLTAHLEKIQEEERARISREIHDELGQQLTGLKMDASWILKKISPEDKPVLDKISSMMLLIDETVKTVRRISSELRPGILDDLGLIPALEWQSQEFEKRTGIKTNFHSGAPYFNPERNLSTNIFRVYQEALTNIARHAQANSVETTLEKKEGSIILTVKDDGNGIDPQPASRKNSLGLIGMRERAMLFNGELLIKSEKQKGTSVILKIPY
jgi:PAS domain S-box-containing protein